MSFVRRAALVLIPLASLGCQPANPVPSNEGMPEVLGALQVHGVKQRDDALATSCRSAADRGGGPAVLTGLPRIDNQTLRDEVAADCALKLHGRNEREAAAEVARLITNPAARDELLSKLNEGS
jgi:hypothetical protein